MPITRTPWIDDDGSGTTGTVLNNAVKTELYNQIDAALPSGVWTPIPYNAANFTGSGSMTWTVDAGDISWFASMVIGKTMFLAFHFVTTSVGGTPSTELRMTVPLGASIVGFTSAMIRAYDGTGWVPVYVLAASGVTYVSLNKIDGGTWPVSTNGVHLNGSLFFPIL